MQPAIDTRRNAVGVLRNATLAVVATFVFIARPAAAQVQPDPTLQAVLLSDIHFEPFYDPAKVSRLAAAPAGEWKAILTAPPSQDREQRFASLQQSFRTVRFRSPRRS
jgi:hypothetical protein